MGGLAFFFRLFERKCAKFSFFLLFLQFGALPESADRSGPISPLRVKKRRRNTLKRKRKKKKGSERALTRISRKTRKDTNEFFKMNFKKSKNVRAICF